jgi:hypothetical protein
VSGTSANLLKRSNTSINPRPAVVTFLLTEDDADLRER